MMGNACSIVGNGSFMVGNDAFMRNAGFMKEKCLFYGGKWWFCAS